MHLFTTAAVDNIDHNPTSRTAQDSFHGTGISLFQHPSAENPGTIAVSSSKSVCKLPESAVAMKKRKAKAKQQCWKSKKRGGNRLSTFDLCQLVQAKSISSHLELVSLAVAQVREGKTTLAEFIANRVVKQPRWPNLLPTGEVKRSMKPFS